MTTLAPQLPQHTQGSAAEPGGAAVPPGIRLVPLPPQYREKMERAAAARAVVTDAAATTSSEGPDIRVLAGFFDRTYRQHCQSVLWGVLIALLSVAPLLFWLGSIVSAAQGDDSAFWLSSVVLALCLGACVRLFSLPQSLRRTADLLIASDSPHAIGPLLDIFYSGGSALRDDAAKAPLTRLLARLPEEMGAADAREVLREPHRAVLRQTLTAPLNSYNADDRFKYDPAYLLAALRALEHVGDGAALPEVERLAEESVHPEVRSAAHHTFTRLRGLD